MNSSQLLSTILASAILWQPIALSAQEVKRFPTINYSDGPDVWPNLLGAYRIPEIPVIEFANSNRIEQLLRDGRLYLSLRDAIALAIENNLDLAVARYGPLIAQTDTLRTKSGQQLRGVQTQISNLSTGLSVGGGQGARGGNATGITGRAGGQALGGGGGGGGGGGVQTGAASSFFGTQAAPLDPILFGSFDFGHFSNPQTNLVVTGTNALVNENLNGQLGFRKGFLSGATATLLWANTRQTTNSINNNFNPSIRSNITLQVNQPLMRGFGFAVNRRNIVVAKRNEEVSDLAFKQQVIEVVFRVESLYWDFVSLRANVESQAEALRLAQKLFEDNKRRVEIGTLAPIEIVRAEAEVAARQEALTVAETQVLQQETLLKNAISVNGLASPSLISARIIPTDEIEVPADEREAPVEVLMEQAVSSRPEMAQGRIQLGNQDVNLKAIRNARLPTLNVSFDLTNNGLAGQPNPNFRDRPAVVDPFLLGGLGTSLGQIFRRNFPDYQIAFNLTVPLRNRQAQADLTATLLEKRQGEIQLRQQDNSIRLEVQNALIGVEQARARHESAVKARILQEQTLAAEQKKYDLGASTIFLVVQAQRDLTLARSQEIAVINNYVQAKLELDRAAGRLLDRRDITLQQAYEGVVDRPADALPTGSRP